MGFFGRIVAQHYYSATVMPRYEGCKDGFFFPLSYDSLQNALAGYSGQADVFIGFGVGHLSKTKKEPEMGQK
jgi:hypothetical protein